jgi:hypothetical protein
MELRLPQPTPDEAAEGEKAVGEAAALAAGTDLSDREAINRFNELFRADRKGTHLHRIGVCGLWVVAICVFSMFAVLVAHKVLPTPYRYLDVDDVKHLTDFLFTGFLGGLIAKGSDWLTK